MKSSLVQRLAWATGVVLGDTRIVVGALALVSLLDSRRRLSPMNPGEPGVDSAFSLPYSACVR